MDRNFGQNANRRVISVGLAIHIKERLLLGHETALFQHLLSVERFAHRNGLKMFNIGIEKLLILFRMEDGSAEISDLYHF